MRMIRQIYAPVTNDSILASLAVMLTLISGHKNRVCRCISCNIEFWSVYDSKAGWYSVCF